MESYSVEAILSAVDKGFTDSMRSADKSMTNLDSNTQKANTSILDIAKGVGVFKLVDAGIGMVKNSMDGAINRFDTLNKYPVVMEALGYSTQEVDKSMQKLTDGIDGLPTRLDDIVANTQQLAISTGSLDKGTDTAIALNNAFLASGASSDAASRGMEQYRQMLGRGEVDMQSFKSVQETMPIAMDKVAKSFEDRGVTSTNALYDALKKGDITFTEFNDRLIELNDGVGGFADLAQKNSKGIKTSFENIKSAVVKGVEKTIRAIDEGLQGANLGSIADILDKVKEKINEAFGVIQKVVPPAIKTLFDLYNTMKPYLPLMATLLGYFTVFSTVLAVQSKINKVKDAYNDWKKATEGLTIAQKILNTVMKANWIAIIISAVIALVGYIIYLWKTNENFRNAVIKIWGDIKQIISNVAEAVTKAWETTKKFFSGLWDSVKSKSADAMYGVKTHWQGTKDVFNKMWEGMKAAPGKTADYVKDKWAKTKEFFSNIWEGVKQATSAKWESIKSLFAPYVEAVIAPFKPIINFFSGLWENVRSIAASYWEIIKSAIMGPVLLVIDLITGDFSQFKEDLAMIWNNIMENALNIYSKIKEIIVGYFTAIVDTGKNLWNILKDYIVSTWNQTVSSANEIWTSFKNWFKTTVDSIVNGAISNWNRFKQNTVNLFNAAIDAAKQIWEGFKKWIKTTIDNIVNGAIQGWKDLKQWTVDTFNKLVDGAKQAWEDLKQSVRDVVDSVTSIFDKLSEIDLWEAGKAIIDGFVKGLKSAWEGGKEFIGGIGDWIRENKGPISYDKKLLIDNGQAIMGGLNKGIIEGFEKVKSTIDRTTGYFENMPISADFDMTSNLNDLNRQLSNSSMSVSSNNDITLKESSKPAYFSFRLGNQNFKAFVNDISEAIDGNMVIDLDT